MLNISFHAILRLLVFLYFRFNAYPVIGTRMSVILPLPHSTTLTTTASCLSSALLTNEAWYDNESGFCESGVQLASENDNMCGINLLDSCEVATTLARIEDSATDDSDWSDDRASSDDSEQNYHIMNSAPYSYINEINNGT